MGIMEKRLHTLTITIYNRDSVYQQVGNLLHEYADKILLRTGYPIKEKNIAIIFLIVEMTNDELGALSGKLGQLKNVKVSATTIKTSGHT
jgi:putative iron-only hydrogenase system regulator